MKQSLVAFDARMLHHNLSLTDLGVRTVWRVIGTDQDGFAAIEGCMQSQPFGDYNALHLVLDCSTGAPALGRHSLTPETAGLWHQKLDALSRHLDEQSTLCLYVNAALLRKMPFLLRHRTSAPRATHLVVHTHDLPPPKTHHALSCRCTTV